MAIIQSLHIYPIKSCAGVALESATLGHAGLESQGAADREWMVVDADTGLFLTQRQAPRMALIQPTLGSGLLNVHAPGRGELPIPLDGAATRRADRHVKVWTHECGAIDEGDSAAALGNKRGVVDRQKLIRFPSFLHEKILARSMRTKNPKVAR